MPRGASPRREREYRELKHRFEEEHRYPGREDEVAARIVNKQRAQYGETKRAKRQRREDRSPDRDLPIKGYRTLTVPEVARRLSRLSRRELEKVRRYERDHKQRKGVLERIDRQLG